MKQSRRRKRWTSLITAVGLLLLFICCFALPEALVALSKTQSGASSQPLDGRGWFNTILGFSTLLVGGVLTIVGVVLRRTATPEPVEEDLLLEEQYGPDTVVRAYDPLELNPHLRTRERRRQGGWED